MNAVVILGPDVCPVTTCARHARPCPCLPAQQQRVHVMPAPAPACLPWDNVCTSLPPPPSPLPHTQISSRDTSGPCHSPRRPCHTPKYRATPPPLSPLPRTRISSRDTLGGPSGSFLATGTAAAAFLLAPACTAAFLSPPGAAGAAAPLLELAEPAAAVPEAVLASRSAWLPPNLQRLRVTGSYPGYFLCPSEDPSFGWKSYHKKW